MFDCPLNAPLVSLDVSKSATHVNNSLPDGMISSTSFGIAIFVHPVRLSHILKHLSGSTQPTSSEKSRANVLALRK